MKVTRMTTADVDSFQVGDIINFTLADGEQAQAMAMKQEQDGMIFLFVNCLLKEYRMNAENSNRGGYDASDLRVDLNGEILNRLPPELREKLVPFANGDLLRLPTEKEIFGKNEYGDEESESVQQWEPMKLRRNRIAFQGQEGAWEWYWLENRREGSAASFAYVGNDGGANCYAASGSRGVRPAFKIRNL